MGEYDNELKDIEFLYTVTPDEIDITKLNGLAPCRICVIQNTCTQSIRCENYQKWRKGFLENNILKTEVRYLKNTEPIELELKQFRHNVKQLIYFEEKVILIALELSGDTLKSPTIKSMQEAKYQKGTAIYNNRISELILEEASLKSRRDYYLTAVSRVSKYLQCLDPEEVELLEMYCWKRYTIRKIAELTYQSKSSVYKKIQSIYAKVDMST